MMAGRINITNSTGFTLKDVVATDGIYVDGKRIDNPTLEECPDGCINYKFVKGLSSVCRYFHAISNGITPDKKFKGSSCPYQKGTML